MTTRKANTRVPRLRAPRSARNDGERQRQIQGSLVLRLAALAQDDGGESESTGGTPLSNPGQRMGAATRTMGLAPLAASFGRGGGRWREAFVARYPTESEGDRL